MAKGRKTGGRDFVKGHTYGNGKKLTSEQKKMSAWLRGYSGKLAIAKIYQTPYLELKKITDVRSKTSQEMMTGELLIARIFEKAVAKGDMEIFNRFYVMLFGNEENYDGGPVTNINETNIHTIFMRSLKEYQKKDD